MCKTISGYAIARDRDRDCMRDRDRDRDCMRDRDCDSDCIRDCDCDLVQ